MAYRGGAIGIVILWVMVVPSWLQAQEMTLEECEAIALRDNPLIHAANQDIEVFRAKYHQALWSWFPHIDIKSVIAPIPAARGNAAWGYTDYNEWGIFSRTEVKAIQPLYTFGKLSSLIEMAERGVDVSDAKTTIAKNEISLKLREYYWGWQLSYEFDEILSEGVKELHHAEEKILKKRDSGDPDYDQTDFHKLRIAKAEVKGRELEARRLKQLAKEGVLVIMGMDRTASLELKEKYLDTLEIDIKDLDFYFKLAEQHRPDLRAIAKGMDALTAQVDLRESQFYPDLFLAGFFNYGYAPVVEGQDSPFASDPFNTSSGGGFLGLSMDLDIAVKVAKLDEAKAQRAKLGFQQQMLKKKAQVEIHQYWMEVKDYQELLDVQRKAFKSARSWLMSEKEAYDNDLGTLSDLITPIEKYFKQKLLYLEMKYKFNMAVARLSKAVGTDIVKIDKKQ